MTDVGDRAPAGASRPGTSTAELVRDAAEQMSRLVRDELALARAEMAAKGKRVGVGAGLLGGGGVVALYGVGVLLAAAVLGLDVVMPAWLAALIVGIAVLAVAGVMALLGRNQVAQATPAVPEETIRSVKADIDEVKGRVRR